MDFKFIPRQFLLAATQIATNTFDLEDIRDRLKNSQIM